MTILNRRKGLYQKDGRLINFNSVAGAAGADYFGIATAANLINVKVMNKDNEIYLALVVEAINQIVAAHQNKCLTLKGWAFRGSVMNLFASPWHNHKTSA